MTFLWGWNYNISNNVMTSLTFQLLKLIVSYINNKVITTLKQYARGRRRCAVMSSLFRLTVKDRLTQVSIGMHAHPKIHLLVW